jgi:hypothetical protein
MSLKYGAAPDDPSFNGPGILDLRKQRRLAMGIGVGACHKVIPKQKTPASDGRGNRISPLGLFWGFACENKGYRKAIATLHAFGCCIGESFRWLPMIKSR